MQIKHDVKGQLARLLATEDLVVEHRKIETAEFNVQTRVLTLPLWDKASENVIDMLVSHEVGHALETPYEGWHDNPETLDGCPRTYINVIEDARIERKVKDKYPGLRRSFAKGYTKLFQEDLHL